MHIEQKKSPNQHEKNMGRVKTKKPDPMDLIPGDMRDNLSFLLSMAKEITNALKKGLLISVICPLLRLSTMLL